MPDVRVRRGAEQHHRIAQPPHGRLDLARRKHGEGRLRARLRRRADRVRERARVLNLHHGDDGDKDAKNAADRHHVPEGGRKDLRVAIDLPELPREEHEGEKEERRVDVVVERQPPLVAVDRREHALDEDGVQRDKQARDHARDDPSERNLARLGAAFLLHAEEEAAHDHGAADNRRKRRVLSEKDARERDVEDRRQRPTDVVERDPNKLEADIIKRDHPNENGGQRQRLERDVETILKLWEHRELLGPLLREEAAQPQTRGTDDALVPRNEQRRFQLHVGAAEKVLVEEDHRDGDDPIRSDDERDRHRLRQAPRARIATRRHSPHTSACAKRRSLFLLEHTRTTRVRAVSSGA
eukprot:Opistho-1_new@61618